MHPTKHAVPDRKLSTVKQTILPVVDEAKRQVIAHRALWVAALVNAAVPIVVRLNMKQRPGHSATRSGNILYARTIVRDAGGEGVVAVIAVDGGTSIGTHPTRCSG